MLTSELPSTGVLRVRVTDDLLLDGGTWNLTEGQDRRPIAKITPPAAPMFQQVVSFVSAWQLLDSTSLARQHRERHPRAG